MIPALFVAALSVLALFYVIAPLRRGPRRDVARRSSRLDEAYARKQEALTAIVDLERDHAAGKLERRDLDALTAEQEAKALAAMRDIDALEQNETSEDVIEEEIAAARRRLECPRCGSPREPGPPCPRCGSA